MKYEERTNEEHTISKFFPRINSLLYATATKIHLKIFLILLIESQHEFCVWGFYSVDWMSGFQTDNTCDVTTQYIRRRNKNPLH